MFVIKRLALLVALGVLLTTLVPAQNVGASPGQLSGCTALMSKALNSRGPCVVYLQEALNLYGYHLDPDGIFGPATDKAVRAFQASAGLERDGVVGPLTRAALLPSVPTPQLPPSPTRPYEVVLVGDSYSAGNGAAHYYGPDGCYRSHANWAEKYMSWLNQSGYKTKPLTNVACSGATTTQFFQKNRRPGDEGSYQGVCLVTPQSADEYIDDKCQAWLKPQMEALQTSTDLVLFTFGGNNVHFADIVNRCFVPAERDASSCQKEVTTARKIMEDTSAAGLKKQLMDVLDKIHQKSPFAKVVLMGYPHLVGNINYKVGSYAAGNAIRDLNTLGTATQLAAVQEINNKYRAEGAFVTYIPTAGAFAGHEPDPGYSANPATWLLEVGTRTISPLTYYHPNPAGQTAYFDLLSKTFGVPAGWRRTP